MTPCINHQNTKRQRHYEARRKGVAIHPLTEIIMEKPVQFTNKKPDRVHRNMLSFNTHTRVQFAKHRLKYCVPLS